MKTPKQKDSLLKIVKALAKLETHMSWVTKSFIYPRQKTFKLIERARRFLKDKK